MPEEKRYKTTNYDDEAEEMRQIKRGTVLITREGGGGGESKERGRQMGEE